MTPRGPAPALPDPWQQELAAAKAARRLAQHGLNALRAAPPRPAWRRLLAQFRDPLGYLVLAAILISLLAWGIEGHSGWPVDAVVIAVVVVLNAVLGCVRETRAADAGAFGSVPLSLLQWAVCGPWAACMLWLGELRKWGLRLHERRRVSGLGRPQASHGVP